MVFARQVHNTSDDLHYKHIRYEHSHSSAMLEAGYIRKVVYCRVNRSGLVCRARRQLHFWHWDEQKEDIAGMNRQKIWQG
jgi:hypothetical protein